MVLLICALVGFEGGLFPVRLDDSAVVGELKYAIKKMNKRRIQCDADKLELYLAKKDDGTWLESSTDDVKQLKRGGMTPLIQALIGEENEVQLQCELQEVLKGMPPPSSQQIHVLVVVPEDDSNSKRAKLTTFGKMLRDCKVSHKLPTEGDFLKLFEWTEADCGEVKNIKEVNDIVHFTGPKFYVRKEILCVLQNFKSIYQSEFVTGEMVRQEFVLMGSPGTGKSCILALLCVYIAIKGNRPVLWLHQSPGLFLGLTTSLFYQDMCYQWDDKTGEMYDSIFDTLATISHPNGPCWFVLDGFNQDQLEGKPLNSMHRMLATSGQLTLKSEAASVTKMCLVPYWKQNDLLNFGLKHMKMEKNEVSVRFYVSGGSLREFLSDNAKITVKAAIDRITGPKHALPLLLSTVGVNSSKQIDCIRMRGVRNRTNALYYMDPDYWTSCVTSQLVLNKLAQMMEPSFFKKLIEIAKGMNDDHLEGVAFEGYFHALVRGNKGLIRVHSYEYDIVDRRKESNRRIDKMSSMDWKEFKVVRCEGATTDECVNVMQNWANDTSLMNYWIPATCLCETIDAVAKWTSPSDNQVLFCFLQLTKATIHKCNADILWELAQPFVKKNLSVRYIALVADEVNLTDFRLNPAEIKKKEIEDHVPLYVAHFEILTDKSYYERS